MAKFLNLQGLQAAWARIKEYVSDSLKASLTDRLGKANGIATLGADSRLTASQLPSLKTVNGQSIIGSGDIAIDLSLYKVVTSLPTTGIETNKIYLVVDPSAPDGNRYKEYIYVTSEDDWELLGEYKTDIDLTPYVKKDEFIPTVTHDVDRYAVLCYEYESEEGTSKNSEDVALPIIGTIDGEYYGGVLSPDDAARFKNVVPVAVCVDDQPTQKADSVNIGYRLGNFSKVDGDFDHIPVTIPAATTALAGVMSASMFNKLNGISSGATADEALTTDEINAILI